MNTREIVILQHILSYCEQINIISNEFGFNKERFLESVTFRNAICLCLLQIGELVGTLDSAFKESHSEIQWREVKLLRNIIAHRYGQIDFEIIWDICISDIPVLREFCVNLLKEG